MTAAQTQPTFSFHIEGGEEHVHAVPAVVLVQILENAQRAFELIGVHVEGRGIKERARVSSATSQRFQLVCQVPMPGSYAMPVTIGGTGELFLRTWQTRHSASFVGLWNTCPHGARWAWHQSCPMNASAAEYWSP